MHLAKSNTHSAAPSALTATSEQPCSDGTAASMPNDVDAIIMDMS